MYISRGYFYSQNKAVSVTSGMRFVGKLPLMLAFYEHSAVWIGCGHRFFRHPAGTISTMGSVFVVLVFFVLNRLLSQLLPLRIYFPPELLGVYLCRLSYFFLLELLLVRTGLDMGSVNENRIWGNHFIVQRLV